MEKYTWKLAGFIAALLTQGVYILLLLLVDWAFTWVLGSTMYSAATYHGMVILGAFNAYLNLDWFEDELRLIKHDMT